MSIGIQLLSFLVSFIYGSFYYFTSLFNKKIINDKSIMFKIILTGIYVINCVLVYLIILYKTNYGNYHIYFMLFLIIGFVYSNYLHKKYTFKFKLSFKLLKKKIHW